MAEETPKTTPTEPTTEPTTEPSGETHRTPTTSDLMTSAKTVAEAAQAAATQGADKIDKAKVAGAADDLIEGAKSYGKLDETQGVGSYLNKAQDYLHSMEKGSAAGAGGEKPAEEKDSGGAAGGFMNMAKGLFK